MPDLYPFAAPFIRLLDPETGHRLAIGALKRGLIPACGKVDDPTLRTTVWGRDFPNPIGTAAGFDKNAEVVDATLRLGFGFAEVGTITPRAQPGNPKPRLFRLWADEAVINRMGFNNAGLDAVLERLKAQQRNGIVAVNLGKNKDAEDAVGDYVTGVKKATPQADFLVLNVSSPNTPGLRGLQNKSELGGLLEAALGARNGACQGRTVPVLVKVAPDLTDDELKDIAGTCVETGIDGIVATNTTISRPEGLSDPNAGQAGGLAGRPLLELSTRILHRFYGLTGGKLPLIGVGGVSSGADAYAKIRAGASLVQLYSAMVFSGPNLVNQVNRELAALLRRDGFSCIADAVGADHA
ncbi:MAG: quinone-dependent dihydroorotate dehydrogenase [Rhodospirillales bacterium]|nr:quinone-dependent dihydroorotate dehydrogenase [Rhodospirillales bacterium]